ncbi:MAG: methyltransferase domain-containing protein [Bacteroidetes bacterium]|nr:methyltransferase domain-containing protein [Bacteroidota bacterium]
MEPSRRPFQGVLNIVNFNRHFYYGGFIALAVIIGCFLYFSWPTWLLCTIVLAFLYGLIAPLLVSAYVYDFSGFYDFNWLQAIQLPTTSPIEIVNINAGFDETSFIIKQKFPTAQLRVFDFYNPQRHTEPAIVRARKLGWVYPGTAQIQTNCIPLPNASVDVLFLLSAAHEIRTAQEKGVFLSECRRVCKPGASVVMVEHLRDLPNFLAFTIGFTHFYAARVWKHSFVAAGFSSCAESKFTPFMSIFTCHP